MPNPSLTCRVAPDVRARVQRCADTMTASGLPGFDAADCGTVTRRLILLALPMLERELGIAPTHTRKRKTHAR